jgi:hypothetical protein
MGKIMGEKKNIEFYPKYTFLTKYAVKKAGLAAFIYSLWATELVL